MNNEYLVWLYILNHKLSVEEHNRFIKKVAEAGLKDAIFKTPITEYKDLFNDFMDGKYEVVRVKD